MNIVDGTIHEKAIKEIESQLAIELAVVSTVYSFVHAITKYFMIVTS